MPTYTFLNKTKKPTDYFREHLLEVVRKKFAAEGNGMVLLSAHHMLKLWDELVELRAKVNPHG